ncbi:MAG TPA: potassium channel family protein [Candidatus Sulfotelmatobacter sp.]
MKKNLQYWLMLLNSLIPAVALAVLFVGWRRIYDALPFWAHGRNGWLIVTFLVFIGTIVGFGVVYMLLSKKRRSHFIFNSDIVAAQKQQVQHDVAGVSQRLQLTLTILRECLAVVENSSEQRKIVSLDSGARCECIFDPGDTLAAEFSCLPGSCIKVYSSENKLLGEYFIYYNESTSEALSRTLNRVEKEYSGVVIQLQSLTTPLSDVWSFIDFLYFSTMTQTTVGYGDILPNSSAVRKVVMLQVLVGYALVLIVLNLVLSR